MDFSNIDITTFLRASMPRRFQDLTPYDFEAFLAWVFRQDGYAVEETSYSGDFGADLILERSGERTVVQIKRYAPGTHVGVSDLNQVIGAKTYYEADSALVITTSEFTGSAIPLGRSAGVVLWNWTRLTRYLSTVLLENADMEEFLMPEPTEELQTDDDAWFSLIVTDINNDESLENDNAVIELRFALHNQSGQNLTLHLDLPAVVSRKTGRQVSAIAWKEHYFFHGMLVNDSSVETCCYFLAEQIPEIRNGDRLLLRIHAGDQPVFLLDEIIKMPGKGPCYVVTWCYGTDSPEYAAMTGFRDRMLLPHPIGRVVVATYYTFSPHLVRFAGKYPEINAVLKPVVAALCRLVMGRPFLPR